MSRGHQVRNGAAARRAGVGLALAGMTVASVLTVPGGPARATGCSVHGKPIAAKPWAQKMLDPDRVTPFTTGKGIQVAILAGGVDASQSQLAGHVAKGKVVPLSHSHTADTDCIGLGTQVAGVIAAQPSNTTAFHGIAPGVTIVPVRDEDTLDEDPAAAGSIDTVIPPDTMAGAINAAVALGVDVIDIPNVAQTSGSDKLKEAVEHALANGVVVVSAVGDNSVSNDKHTSPYPSCYKGVIGVGAIGPDGTVMDTQRPHSCIDLVAPGVKVTSTQVIRGLVKASGTQMASGFVAGTAALVRAEYPDLSPAEVQHRLEATATPAAGESTYYGHGIVNPYEAVADMMATGKPAALPPMRPTHESKAEAAWDRAWSSSMGMSMTLTGAGMLLALLVTLAAVAIPRGRRQRWRAQRANPPVDDPESDMPSPPIDLFSESETQR